VWRALTTPEGLAPWLGKATLELRLDGRFGLQLNDDVFMDGRITALDPPLRLVLAWREIEAGVPTPHATTGNDESELSFELRSEGAGTRLVLVHRRIRPGEQMNGFGAGWHAHLESLLASLGGAPEVDRTDLYQRLHPAYVEAFSGSASSSADAHFRPGPMSSYK
jgi:uncharacterized protein YndB with AHSA1/START domain